MIFMVNKALKLLYLSFIQIENSCLNHFSKTTVIVLRRAWACSPEGSFPWESPTAIELTSATPLSVLETSSPPGTMLATLPAVVAAVPAVRCTVR